MSAVQDFLDDAIRGAEYALDELADALQDGSTAGNLVLEAINLLNQAYNEAGYL